jgi:hypothetical protein
MALEIHISTVLAYLLAFESVTFLLVSAIMLMRWTWYYGSLRPAWGVVFHSEVRMVLYGWLITLNGVGLIVFVLWAIARWMGLSWAW